MSNDPGSLKDEQPVHTRIPPTARDFLANERTFLAYIRSALAFVGFGFVIARFSLFSRELVGEHVSIASTHISVVLGVIMTLAGILVAAYGTKRYVDQDTALRRSDLIALSARSAMLIAGTVIIFGVFIAVALYRIR